MAFTDASDRVRFERRFFLAVAVLFPLTVIAGFAPTYYLKPLFASPPVPGLLVHAHGVVMSAWVVLFGVQVYLIAARRIRVHQRLGQFGIALAAAAAGLGLVTAVAAARRGQTVPGLSPAEFMIVPFGDVAVFLVLFGAAVYYRKRPAEHKRLMLLTVLNFLPPALARMPLETLQSFGPLWFFGFPDALAIAAVIGDTRRNGRLNKVFLAGAVLLIASHWLRLALATSSPWVSFASRLIGTE